MEQTRRLHEIQTPKYTALLHIDKPPDVAALCPCPSACTVLSPYLATSSIVPRVASVHIGYACHLRARLELGLAASSSQGYLRPICLRMSSKTLAMASVSESGISGCSSSPLPIASCTAACTKNRRQPHVGILGEWRAHGDRQGASSTGSCASCVLRKFRCPHIVQHSLRPRV
jgi:hypothetical protein